MERTEIIYSSDDTVVFLPELDAIAHLGTETEPTKKPITPIDTKPTGSTEFQRWGDDNLFPQNLVDDYYKDDQIPSLINWKIKTLISGGLVYGNLEFDANGNEKMLPFYDQEITDFQRKSALNRYSLEAASDFYWFQQFFPELITNDGRDKVVTITVQEAAFCRYAKQNTSTGRIPHVYISANWRNRPALQDIPKVPVLDPYYDPALTFKNSGQTRMIYPCSMPSPDSVYYQTPEHNGLRVSGWLDIARSIPEFKKNLMKNQISIKYHIKIPKDYWLKKYPDWASMSLEDRKAKKTDKLTEFVEFMKGEKNAGIAFMSEYDFDPITKASVFGWIIEAIDNKIKDGIYLEDSQEASAHILRAFGLDPTLVGQGPGRNSQAAGSGSDKRVAREIYLLNAKVDQDIILDPLNNVINEYNGWLTRYPKMVWWFRNYFIAAQNQVNPLNRI